MLVLGLTTSDPECGIAIMKNGDICSETIFAGPRVCLEQLIPLIEKALAGQDAGLKDIDLLSADIGPGGLTGIKIGIVAMRTLSQTLGIKVVPVSPLHAVAYLSPLEYDFIFVASNCSAKEVFSAAFIKSGCDAPMTRVLDDRFDTPESAARRFIECAKGKRILVTGSATDRLHDALLNLSVPADYDMAPPESRPPRARAFCMLAEPEKAVDWSILQANYLCLTGAERMHIEKEGKTV